MCVQPCAANCARAAVLDTCTQRVLRMAAEFKDRLAAMIADWIRVGFCQGNFNADNCLVGGRTMDYGPFGTAAAACALAIRQSHKSVPPFFPFRSRVYRHV